MRGLNKRAVRKAAIVAAHAAAIAVVGVLLEQAPELGIGAVGMLLLNAAWRFLRDSSQGVPPGG